ncbi:MAG: hypothetical protein ACRDFB_07625, partial [Rhabdochlamydiaceae bacterium]
MIIPQLFKERQYFQTYNGKLIVRDSSCFSMGYVMTPRLGTLKYRFCAHNDKVDVFAPIVHERGMCSLEEAVNPLLSTLQSYIDKNPKKPVCLLGVSNGSRMVTYLEVQL